MNAAQMKEVLQTKYPLIFSIPGKNEIKSYIGAKFQKSKYQRRTGSAIMDEVEDQVTSRKQWNIVVEHIVENNPTAKPEDIYQTFSRDTQTTSQEALHDVSRKDGSLDKKSY